MLKNRLPRLLIALLVALGSLSTDSYAGPARPRQRQRKMNAVFPFARYIDPFSTRIRDTTGIDVFVSPGTGAGDSDSASSLLALTMRGKVYLLELGRRGWMRTRWLYRAEDSGRWQRSRTPFLALSSMPKDTYEIRTSSRGRGSASTIPEEPLWVAWPTNAIRADISPPAGAVHGSIVDGPDGTMQLNAWGYAYDAMQAGLGNGSNGVARAFLVVDRKRVPISLDADGAFETTVEVKPRRRGIHVVSLHAVGYAHRKSCRIDTEYVSEYGWPLHEAPSANPGTWSGSVANSCLTAFQLKAYYRYLPTFMSYGTSDSNTVAVAVPRLNDEGLLVLDGSDSINVGKYQWTVQSLHGEYTVEKSGETVGTEDIPAGLYRVTLECTAPPPPPVFKTIDADLDDEVDIVIDGDGPYPPPEPDPPADEPVEVVDNSPQTSVTSLLLVIPPRIALEARAVTGSLHIRWTPRLVKDEWKWVMHFGGHVFDEIGATLFGHGPENMKAWVELDGTRVDLEVDSKGHLHGEHTIGLFTKDEYRLKLRAQTQDNSEEDTVDSRYEVDLTLFPPWHRFFEKPPPEQRLGTGIRAIRRN